MLTPRGISNNNPCNIRISSTPWHNKIVPNKDGVFEQFITAEDGLHAGATNVCNYQRFHGLQTIKEIISRYAPAIENETGSYILDVCKRMGVAPTDRVNLLEPKTLTNLVTAIIWHENGQCPYSDSEIFNQCLIVIYPNKNYSL